MLKNFVNYLSMFLVLFIAVGGIIMCQKREELASHQPNLPIIQPQSPNIPLDAEPVKQTLYIFEADWCFWCKKMEKEVLVKQEIQKILTEFNIVRVNIDKQPKLKNQYQINGVPAYVIIDSKGNVVKKEDGYKSSGEFMKFLGK